MSQNLIQYELMLFSDHDITKIYMACNLIFDYEYGIILWIRINSLHCINLRLFLLSDKYIFGKNIQR